VLRPDKQYHTFLISSTSQFFGEYESEDILITHAWPQWGRPYLQEGVEHPHSRNYYILSLNIGEGPQVQSERRQVAVPSYGYFGELFCSCMSVFYGKRFDSHGLVYGGGFFNTPSISFSAPLAYHSIGPNNYKPRNDFPVALNFVEFARISPFFMMGNLPTKARDIFFAAARFYLRSLRNFEDDPEASYLDLITCGELLSGFYEFPESLLYDPETSKLLKNIVDGHAHGHKISRAIKGRLFQVKRRFVLTILRLLYSDFFNSTQASAPFAALKEHQIQERLMAAYDLRSIYVHTGAQFGGYLRPHLGIMNEIMLGVPVIEGNKKLVDALTLAPTFLGLERLMRVCLLRFVHQNLFKFEPRFDIVGLKFRFRLAATS